MSGATPRPAGAGRDVLVVFGALLLLGVLAGVVWWLLVDPAQFTKTAQGGAMSENQLGKQFGADAWFVVIGLVTGLLAGLALAGWRSRDPLLVSGLLLVGSLLAAGTALLVGHLLGPGDPGAALRAAKVGAHVPDRLGVDTPLAWLGWPFGVLTGALFVLLGRAPEQVGPEHDLPGGAPEPAGSDQAPAAGGTSTPAAPSARADR